MKYVQVLLVTFILVVVVSSRSPPEPGYNYKPPGKTATTRGTTRRPLIVTTKKPFNYQSDQKIDSAGLRPEAEHEPGMPFDFTYAVKDDVGNDFSHNAQSNGDVVNGEYKTLLPDGRLQIVKYTADWKNGYNAEITYQGEAKFPDQPSKKSG